MGDLKATLADQLEALDCCKTSAENMLIETYRRLRRDLEEQAELKKGLVKVPVHEFIEKAAAAVAINVRSTYTTANLGVVLDGQHFSVRSPLAEPIPPGPYRVLIIVQKLKDEG